MAEEYRSLETLFHSDDTPERYAHAEAEEHKRREDECSLHTGIETDVGELFMLVPRELAVMTEKVLRVERKVTTPWRSLPGVARWAFIRGLIVDEVFSTNEMEGVHSTRRQIKDALDSAESRIPSIQTRRFREFANLYLELTKPNLVYPKTPEDIRGIYDSVVAGEPSRGDLPDGSLFRASAVDVQGMGGKVVHTGVMPETAIIEMMDEMLVLVASEDLPQVYSAVMSHFVFEYTHHFYDANGRTGRYLLALYLSEPLSLPTVLSLSRMIAENTGGSSSLPACSVLSFRLLPRCDDRRCGTGTGHGRENRAKVYAGAGLIRTCRADEGAACEGHALRSRCRSVRVR
jgi:hypothetical protein